MLAGQYAAVVVEPGVCDDLGGEVAEDALSAVSAECMAQVGVGGEACHGVEK